MSRSIVHYYSMQVKMDSLKYKIKHNKNKNKLNLYINEHLFRLNNLNNLLSIFFFLQGYLLHIL